MLDLVIRGMYIANIKTIYLCLDITIVKVIAIALLLTFNDEIPPTDICLKCGNAIAHIPYKYKGQTFHARCLICTHCGKYNYCSTPYALSNWIDGYLTFWWHRRPSITITVLASHFCLWKQFIQKVPIHNFDSVSVYYKLQDAIGLGTSQIEVIYCDIAIWGYGDVIKKWLEIIRLLHHFTMVTSNKNSF